jgi:hypothetical protein
MRAPMGFRHVLLAIVGVAQLCGLGAAGALLGGCGKEIGDACTIATDCSPNADRICQCSNCSGTDPMGDSANGYCTIQGCDFGTCPSEAVCVRFFTGGFTNPPNKTCAPDAPQDQQVTCSVDELCALSGNCVPRSSEIRYCMKTCESGGDCRESDGYECRDLTLMMEHGGQPVDDPNNPPDPTKPPNPPKFCAAKP